MGLDHDAEFPDFNLDQLDPEHEAFWRVRGFDTRPADWKERFAREQQEEERAFDSET